MKSKILELLSTGRDLCTASIALALDAKRASVAKCLTRMVRAGDVHFQRSKETGKIYYKIPIVAAAANSAPVASASGVAIP